MKLLLINHYAGGPARGMEYRPFYLAREWVRQGHEVLVVGATHSHVRTVQPEPGTETVEGVRFLWLATPAYQGNGVGRLRNIMAFLSGLAQQTPHLAAWKPDAVIASSTYPMDHWLAKRIARQAGAVLVHEVHDLWPLTLTEVSGLSAWHPFVLICASAERAAYRDSDLLVSMLPNARSHYLAHGLQDERKLVVIPNGISPEEWRQDGTAPMRADVEAAIDSARQKGGVVVGYAGSMGVPNALGFFLDAMARVRGDNLHAVLVGQGHEREALAGRIAAEGLDHVHLLPPLPKAQVPGFLAAVDIAYLGWRKTPLYRFGIAPNKLMDYMMAERAVLHSVEAGNDPVAEARCGLTVAPENPEAIAQGLRELAVLSPRERRKMGERGRPYVLKHHAYPQLARRFVQAIEQARRRGAEGG